MGRDNYRTIARKLSKKEEFRGNSMWARWEPGNYVNDDVYKVYSYSTVIAWAVYGHKPVLDLKPYSKTTSRHQNLCKVYLADGEYEEIG